MEDSRMFNGPTPSPGTGWGRDRQRLPAEMGRVKVHGTVPGSSTMRRAGEVFAMRPATRDGGACEEQ